MQRATPGFAKTFSGHVSEAHNLSEGKAVRLSETANNLPIVFKCTSVCDFLLIIKSEYDKLFFFSFFLRPQNCKLNFGLPDDIPFVKFAT